MKLYELPAAFAEIEMMTDEDGELPPQAIEMLANLQMAAEEKFDACCRVLKHFESDARSYKEEADRLAKHAATATANAKRLKKYVEDGMKELGMDKLQTDYFKLRLQSNPHSCEYTGDPADLPDEFKVIKVEANKRAAIEAFKAGRELPAGFDVTQGRSLRIG